MNRPAVFVLAAAVAGALAWAVLRPSGATAAPEGVITRWESWTKADGLPDDRVFAVLKAPEGVYAGTEKGLALVDPATRRVVRTWTEAEGLSFPVVTSLCRDEKTGAVYAGTMGGVTRIEGAKATAIHQSKDGLINDVVFSVCTQGRNLWVATAAGLSRQNVDTGAWNSWTEKNSPMKEIWCYSVCEEAGKVYVAIWGSGFLEYDVAKDEFRIYLDPDRDMRFDLFKNDGLLSDVSIGISSQQGTLWIASYLGLTRYDGRNWATWVEDDSGLASSFINSLRANGPECWCCTDKGLSQFDGTRWVTYRRDGDAGSMRVTEGVPATVRTYPSTGALPDAFVWNVAFDGRDVWVATARGLAHGLRNGPAPVATVARSQP